MRSGHIDFSWKTYDKHGDMNYCSVCGVKIWKHWMVPTHKSKGKILPEEYPIMTKCAYHHFGMESNPLQVRHLSEIEIAESKVLLEKLKEDYDTSKQLQKSP
jgi:hypothetical protein